MCSILNTSVLANVFPDITAAVFDGMIVVMSTATAGDIAVVVLLT